MEITQAEVEALQREYNNAYDELRKAYRASNILSAQIRSEYKKKYNITDNGMISAKEIFEIDKELKAKYESRYKEGKDSVEEYRKSFYNSMHRYQNVAREARKTQISDSASTSSANSNTSSNTSNGKVKEVSHATPTVSERVSNKESKTEKVKNKKEDPPKEPSVAEKENKKSTRDKVNEEFVKIQKKAKDKIQSKASKEMAEAQKNIKKFTFDDKVDNSQVDADKAKALKYLKEEANPIEGIKKGIGSIFSNMSDMTDNIKDNAKNYGTAIGKNIFYGGVSYYTKSAKDKQDAIKLEAAKDKVTAQLTDSVIKDNIANEVVKNKSAIQKLGQQMGDQVAAYKSYINQYIKSTFGNPEFVNAVKDQVNQSVQLYVNNMTTNYVNNQVNDVNKKLTFYSGQMTDKINQTTNKILAPIDNALKLDIVESMSKKIENSISLDVFTRKLENSGPLGKALSTTLGPTMSKIQEKALSGLKSAKVLEQINGRIAKLKEGLQKARNFIEEKRKLVLNYVNELQDKVKAAVQQFAQKIVSDIASKISVMVGGALGDAIGGALGGLGGISF